MQGDISSHYVDKIYRSIKAMVVNFEVMPNQPILIGQLAERLHVSATPVREALNQLLKENLVVRGSGRGFYGRPIDAQEFQELLVMRGTLAAGGVRLMLRTALPDAIGNLVQQWRQCTGAERARNELVQPLYGRILQLADNREMLRMHDRTMERVSYLWKCIMTCDVTENRYFRFQRRLVEAIEARSVQRADTVINNATLFEARLGDDLVKQGLLQLHTKSQNRMARHYSS